MYENPQIVAMLKVLSRLKVTDMSTFGALCFVVEHSILCTRGMGAPSLTVGSFIPSPGFPYLPTNSFLVSSTVLGEEKYGPGSEPQWKAGGTRYPNLYKALLEEPSRTRRTKLLEDNSRAKKGDGRIVRRPARARIRNQ